MQTELGPDATSVGWVFQYALVDKSGQHSLAELRTFQDWYLRYALQSVPGVAEVASVGGFVRSSTRSTVDPNALTAYKHRRSTTVVEAHPRKATTRSAAACSSSPGASTWSAAAATSRASRTSRRSSLKADEQGTPVLRAGRRRRWRSGPEIRRGVADLDGEGDTVGGIVVMRHGENALNVIERVKAKLEELEAVAARRASRSSRPTTAPS